MGFFDATTTIRFEPRFYEQMALIALALQSITNAVNHYGAAIMNDLSNLDAKITALEAKATESAATLRALAQAVIDLKNAADKQAEIDALTQRAQTILDTLGAAEDEADDQLPTP